LKLKLVGLLIYETDQKARLSIKPVLSDSPVLIRSTTADMLLYIYSSIPRIPVLYDIGYLAELTTACKRGSTQGSTLSYIIQRWWALRQRFSIFSLQKTDPIWCKMSVLELSHYDVCSKGESTIMATP